VNWSAKGREWLSLHYEGESIFGSTLPYQGVCKRHGVEDTHVTQGSLVRSALKEIFFLEQ
jgi:hypothetical protein